MQATTKYQPPFWVVSARWLLSLYLVVPLCLLVVLIDYSLFDLQLRRYYLPVKPTDWAWWAIVFGTPHILASFFSYADREYLDYYKGSFFPLIVLTALIGCGLPFLIGGGAFLVFFAVTTMYHVLSQQFGIAISLSRIKPGKAFLGWKIFATSSASIVFIWIFSPGSIIAGLSYLGVGNAFITVLATCVILLGIASYCSWLLVKSSKTAMGSWFIVSNNVMLWCCLLLMVWGYSVFVIMIPRIIHDITAFSVYIVHDQNRLSSKASNVLYRLSALLYFPPLVVCPLLALSLSFWLSNTPSMAVIMVLNTLTFLHYFNESRIWKGGSLHRQSMSFSS
ncbi:MAG: hypothetical protein ACRBHB_13140 [Arenicella sp.]